MLRTIARLWIIASVLVPVSAYPQERIHLEVVAGPLFEPSHAFVAPHVGLTVGLGIGYDVSPGVQAVHNISFCRYPNGDWTEAGYYPISDPTAGTSAAGGIFHNGYEVSSAFRIGAPTSPVWSYLSLRTGVQSARIRRRIPGHDHGQWITKGFVSAGIGATVPVQPTWKLLLESWVAVGTDGATVFVPVVTGLQLLL